MAIGKPFRHEPTWWKEGIVYQVYPAFFKDSNDDGVGDIPGIISELDYIRDLGIDIIWISPHYKSPQPYGTLKDCEQLIHKIHNRGMKVIFDLVVNHTDWYFWRKPQRDDAKNLGRPNNWRSQFTKPAWTWDEGQPDLNWENEDCRREIYDNAIKFWLDRGVDGFPIDTVNKFSKDPGLPDAPIAEPNEETQVAICHYANRPRIHEYLEEKRPNTPNLKDDLKYVSPTSGQIDMVFKFDTVNIGQTPGNRFNPTAFDNGDFKRHLTKWQTLPETTGAWTTVFLENHDQDRSISRFASDSSTYREIAAKMLATVLATMTGTLFLYQGQEIGMTNALESWPAENYKCVRSVNYFQEVRERTNGDSVALEQARRNLQRLARDHARVPMQWDDTKTPINVLERISRKGSVLQYWWEIIRLRKTWKSLLIYGTFIMIEQHRALMVFMKTDPGSCLRAFTVANLSHPNLQFEAIPGYQFSTSDIVFGNYTSDHEIPRNQFSLQPFEARVYLEN
ncbi:glycoside hydrolase superfamily [Dactylonectria macrodidyma]|uniref:Glycoside hydrolase superfamily n=1 Tax=Dactylonectria macrodidyma TaxID=307937 RepID=A0A9P9JKH5_9HYPO|nr:glycoside hydrolase superfamily [Dactylonectria macrodidyma]